MRFRGILFDKDGTLFDFHGTWLPVLRTAALLAAQGNKTLAAEMMRVGGFDAATGRVREGSLLAAGHTVDLAVAWAALDGTQKPGDLVSVLDRHFAEGGMQNAAPVTDLPGLFETLRGRGLKLGVATNDSQDTAQLMLSSFGVSDVLDFLAGYDSGFGAKPEPGMIQAFCEKTGLKPDAVVVVGDNRDDLEMGRRGGAGGLVGVLTGTGSRGDLDGWCDHVIPDVGVLPSLLDDWAASSPAT